MTAAFRLDLPVFAGPLDLLLHLVREADVDLREIRVAEIAQQYLTHLEAMTTIDLEPASDWLVTAAWLVWLKSRALLPVAPGAEGEEEDPRSELLARLAEYELIQRAAERLDERPRQGREFWPVRIDMPTEGAAERPWAPHVPEELVAAFERALRRLPDPEREDVLQFIAPRWTIEQGAQALAFRLRPGVRIELERMLIECGERGRAIVMFLALLELVRVGEVRVFGEAQIWYVQAKDPATAGQGWAEKVRGFDGTHDDDRAG